MLHALGRFFKRGASGEGDDPMAFLDEYAAVMNRHARVKVRNGFKWGRTGLSIDNAFSESAVLWLEDGHYCFDEEERGQVRTQGFFNSASMELTQKVMVHYTASFLRHSLGLRRWVCRSGAMSCLSVGCLKRGRRGDTLPLTDRMVSIWSSTL